jgi:hypothetical protein
MAKTKYTREELLAQYGPQRRKRKEQLPTYLEVQSRHLDRHANVDGKCVMCKEIVNGVEQPQAYPCASLRRVGLG